MDDFAGLMVPRPVRDMRSQHTLRPTVPVPPHAEVIVRTMPVFSQAALHFFFVFSLHTRCASSSSRHRLGLKKRTLL